MSSDSGRVWLWRKSKNSKVFAHAGIWKLFCLCLMNAAYEEKEIMLSGVLEPIKLRPGQFVTGRESLHFQYHQGDVLGKRYSRKLKPSAITLYRWLRFLSLCQILNISAHSKYSIITIVNWNEHQKFAQQVNNRRTTGEHKEEVKERKEEKNPAFFSLSSLKERYPDQNLIDQIFKGIASIRKSNKVSESVLVAFLQKCKRYPVQQVQAGFKTYLQKDCAGQGKGEAYLLGIIRNQKAEEPRQESTGSALLDAYYARNHQ